MCSLAPDTDHCAQFVAVQSGDPEDCKKIKWTKFKSGGSNPPRDKCYLTIAQNKSDYTICKNIQWGVMSYTKEECVGGVAQKVLKESVEKQDIEWCVKLSKFPKGSETVYSDCKQKLASIDAMNTRDGKLESVVESLKKDPGNSTLKKELEDLKKQKQMTYEMMGESQRADYFKAQREKVMDGIDDEDVKSAISKEFTTYRQGETNINKMLDKLEEVAEKQKRIKSADEKANQLVDQVKEQLEGLVNDKQDEIVWEMGDKAKEWIEKNGGEEVKWALKDMEWAMGKYEKGSKMYEDAKSKYDKIKGVYDEVMWVYDRVDKVNKLLAEGRIDAGKAKVLKGAVLLDKGLEYATGYVPVFGSTISTISKETFGTVIELAKKRAERSTAIEKCFDDPEHCDTDGISGY